MTNETNDLTATETMLRCLAIGRAREIVGAVEGYITDEALVAQGATAVEQEAIAYVLACQEGYDHPWKAWNNV